VDEFDTAIAEAEDAPDEADLDLSEDEIKAIGWQRTQSHDLSKRTLDPDRPAWHRQPNESVPAYEAFMLYLSSGKDFTQTDTAKALGKSNTLIKRWARVWRWTDRQALYEEHFQLMRLESAEAQRDRMWARIDSLSDKALLIVDANFERFLGGFEEDGTPKEKEEMKADALVRLFTEAVKAQKMAVLARIQNRTESAEEQERIATKMADDMASVLREIMNDLGVPDEQAKEILRKHLMAA
jgi:hypothetical protein